MRLFEKKWNNLKLCFTSWVRDVIRVFSDHSLEVLGEGREDPLRADVLQAGGGGPHHIVITTPAISINLPHSNGGGQVDLNIMLLSRTQIRLLEADLPNVELNLWPGADDHPTSGVVGEAIIANIWVDIRSLGIEPGLLREVYFDLLRGHPEIFAS